MKVLVVADLHYDLRQYDWLLRVGPDYDLVIVAGDLLDLAGHVDRETQILVVAKYLARLGARVPLIVCSGNHDADARNAEGEPVADWLLELREDGVRVDGEHVPLPEALVTVCPWWSGPAARGQLEAMLLRVDRPARGRWIWVHHIPPQGTATAWTGRADAGDAFLRELIARHGPDVVVSGHVHDSPFRDGGSWIDRLGSAWIVNPGRQLGGLPAFVVLDLAADTASWTSLAGAEDRALA